MDGSQTTNPEQIRALVSASRAICFTGLRREEMYQWVEGTLVGTSMAACDGRQGGTAALHRPDDRRVALVPYQRRRLPSVYTAADVTLLAYVDRRTEARLPPMRGWPGRRRLHIPRVSIQEMRTIELEKAFFRRRKKNV